jgi:hypothetical protein
MSTETGGICADLNSIMEGNCRIFNFYLTIKRGGTRTNALWGFHRKDRITEGIATQRARGAVAP